MITLKTKVNELYVGTSCEKYLQNLFYGWQLKDDCRELGSLCEDVWPNKDTVDALNEIEKMDADGRARLIQFDENPEINFIALLHKEKSKCALVYAGGAYACVCNSVEALPVAMHLYKKGYNAFIGTYSINDKARERATKDIANGVRYLINNSKELNIDMNGYLIGGFSAGGHAVGELLTDNLGFKVQDIPLPSVMFLGYPVSYISLTGVSATRDFLLGKNATQEEADYYSVYKHIKPLNMKVYLWQCERDNIISFNNSIYLDKALTENNIDHIYHHYDSDAHGWGIATGKLADGWVDEMVEYSKK